MEDPVYHPPESSMSFLVNPRFVVLVLVLAPCVPPYLLSPVRVEGVVDSRNNICRRRKTNCKYDKVMGIISWKTKPKMCSGKWCEEQASPISPPSTVRLREATTETKDVSPWLIRQVVLPYAFCPVDVADEGPVKLRLRLIPIRSCW